MTAWIGFAKSLLFPACIGYGADLSLGSVETKTRFDVWDRPAYGYGVLAAATLARQLGHKEMIAVEFGVARGDGLIALETICREVGAALGMDIAANGFDSGCGMPKPTDYRDLPHLWSDRFYAMDEAGAAATSSHGNARDRRRQHDRA